MTAPMSAPMVFPDPEIATKDVLKVLMAHSGATFGIGVPADWAATSGPHFQVSVDSANVPRHRVISRPIVRVTVWSQSPSLSKALLLEAEARLAAFPGDGTISTMSTATGLFTARDAANRDAALASMTVRVTVRSTLLA